MKSLCLAMIAVLTLHSAAYAAIDRNVGAPNVARRQPDQAFGLQSVAPRLPDRLVHNPNECAADHADPVWSATLALLGYACTHNENGG